MCLMETRGNCSGISVCYASLVCDLFFIFSFKKKISKKTVNQ